MADILTEKIKHVVLLMLENRSFDSMLGRLYPSTDGFDGLSGYETNPDPAGGQPIQVWNQPGGGAPVSMKIPDPDPGELWTDMNTQIFGVPAPGPGAGPTMQGFTINYAAQGAAGTHPPHNVMHYYIDEQLPVMSRLARQFAVCDRWFASAPCQTWPNRFFAHTGTANGYQNNSPPHFPYTMPTVFNLMSARFPAVDWKIYYHDVPQTLTLSRLWPHLGGFRYFEEFLSDARGGTLPGYSFIEPRYFTDAYLPNDQHPPHVVTLGEQLIADVYNALRANEQQWKETLLVVTYDEHGGLYDHVSPPGAVPPELPRPGQAFKFDRYGVRVPALLLSPYIRRGTVLRPPGNTPFDHTSIIATLRRCFSLGPPLTARDAAAPDVGSVFNLQEPINLGPDKIERPVYVADPKQVALARAVAPNDMQKALVELAAHLPSSPDVPPANFAALVASHIATLAAAPANVPVHASVGDAAHYVKNELSDFLRNL